MMTYEKLETILRRMSDCAYDLEKSAEILDHDQAQRARIQELEQWQKIVIGTGTDQESVIRMAATEYTKVAIQSWQEKCEQQAKEIERLQAANNDWQREFKTAVDGYNAVEKDCETLREALQLLYDCQNGCPLPKYEADWNRAMELAQHALKEVSG